MQLALQLLVVSMEPLDSRIRDVLSSQVSKSQSKKSNQTSSSSLSFFAFLERPFLTMLFLAEQTSAHLDKRPT